MTDNTVNDDVYNDPENILANTDDTVDGATELRGNEANEESQSIFVPERDGDDRGSIPELEGSDGTSRREETSGVYPEDEDLDANQLADLMPADEHDGTDA